MTQVYGGTVASIERRSIAEEAGILPGDVIASINGHPLSDIIDYRFYSAEEELEVIVRRGQEQLPVTVEKDCDEPLGIEFADELFDGVRTCGNRCIFCFVDRLPRGMRRSLYLKDDDFRLSFLHGNFVTLTNADEADIRRIIEQRLSPMYVSVHATEPGLRRRMLGADALPDVTSQLRVLSAGRITLHTQIVLCPGVNDGEHLEQTVRHLASLYPGVASIGIVPVGLTKYGRAGVSLCAVGPALARETVRRAGAWQREFLAALGTRLVWASDELYLLAGLRVPAASAYEGYPQLENGIGLIRRFVDEAKKTVGRLPASLPHPVRATLVTGTLAAPLLRDFADRLNGIENVRVRVEAVRNEFFGRTVTVAGLLTGSDVARQLRGEELGDVVIVPKVMLRDGAFLDDMSANELSSELATPVVAIGPLPGALADALRLVGHSDQPARTGTRTRSAPRSTVR